MRETFSLILGGLLVVLNIGAISLYVMKIRKGGTIPNPASWIIWSIVAGVNVISYQAGTHDMVKSINGYVSTGNCMFMFAYCLWHGQLKKMSTLDRLAIGIAILAVLCWAWSGKAWYGNLLVQLAVIMSFSLTIGGILKGTRREWWVPWALWTSCHSLTLGIVLLRWENDPYALIYPALGITCNALVTLSALWKHRRTL